MDSALFPPVGLRRTVADKPGLPRIASNPSAAAVVLELAAFVAKLQIQAAQNAAQLPSEAPKRSSHSRRGSVTFSFDSHGDTRGSSSSSTGEGAVGQGEGEGSVQGSTAADVTSPGLVHAPTSRSTSSLPPPSTLPPRHPSSGVSGGGGSRRESLVSTGGSVDSHGEGSGGQVAALVGSPTAPAASTVDLSTLRVSISVEEVQLLAHLVDSLQPLLVGGSIRLPSIEEAEGHSMESDSSHASSSPADRPPALLRTSSGHSLVDTVREQLSKGGSALAGMGAILQAAQAMQQAQQGQQGVGETPVLDVSTPGTVYSPAAPPLPLPPPRGTSFSFPNMSSGAVPALAVPVLERLAIGRGEASTGHSGIEISEWTAAPPSFPASSQLASPTTVRAITGVEAGGGEGGGGAPVLPSQRPRLMSSLSSDGNTALLSLRRAATAIPSPAPHMAMTGPDGSLLSTRGGRGTALHHFTSLADMSVGGGAPLTSRASKRRNSRLRIDDELAKSFAAHPSVFNDEAIRDYVTSLVSTAEDEARKAKAAKAAALKVGSGQLGLAAAADKKFKRAGISVTQAVTAVSGMGGLAGIIDAFKAGTRGPEGEGVEYGGGDEGGGNGARPSVGEELGSLVNAHVSEAGSTGGSDEGTRQGQGGQATTAHSHQAAPVPGTGGTALLSLLPYPLSAASPTASRSRQVSSADSLPDQDTAGLPMEGHTHAPAAGGIAVRPPPVPRALPQAALPLGGTEEGEQQGVSQEGASGVQEVQAAAPPSVPTAVPANRTVSLFAKRLATRRASNAGAAGRPGGTAEQGGAAPAGALPGPPAATPQAEAPPVIAPLSPAKPPFPAVSPATLTGSSPLVEHDPVPLPSPSVRAALLADLGQWSFDLLAVNAAIVQAVSSGRGQGEGSSDNLFFCVSPVGSPTQAAAGSSSGVGGVEERGSEIVTRSPASPLGINIIQPSAQRPEDLQAASLLLYRRLPFAASSAGVGIESLVSVAMHACGATGVQGALALQQPVMHRYFTALAKAYDSNLSYHNALHAADVLQAVFYCLTKCGMSPGGQAGVHEAASPAARLTPLQTCAMLLAAAAHDVGHPGLNNPFLVSSSHELAITYNDRSPLENMHAATAFLLMKQPGCDLLAPLDTEQRATMRASVVGLILATDNGQHFKMVKKLQGRVSRWSRAQAAAQRSRARWMASAQAGSEGPLAAMLDDEEPPLGASEDEEEEEEDDDEEEESGGQAGSGGAGEGAGSQAGTPRGEDGELAMLSPTAAAAVSAARLAMSRKNDEKVLLHAVLHGCDIANPARPWTTAAAWASAVTAEFHAQGDAMRRLGMPVPPMFDAQHAGQARKRAANQIGFIMALVLPLWSTLAEEPYASILGPSTARGIVDAIQGNLNTLGAITSAGVEANLVLEDEHTKADNGPQ